MPKGFNTPAATAFGIVAIASLAFTSLVCGIVYYKASHDNSDKKWNKVGDALTWTNPITALVNIVDSVVQCCKGQTKNRNLMKMLAEVLLRLIKSPFI